MAYGILPLLIATAAVALAATGGARFSLDNALGWADSLSGLRWGAGAALGGVLAALAVLVVGRHPAGGAAPSGQS